MIFYDKPKVITGDNTLFPREDHRWVLALNLGYWIILLFALSWIGTLVVTMYFTSDYIKYQLRPSVNEKTAYVIYKYGLPKRK